MEAGVNGIDVWSRARTVLCCDAESGGVVCDLKYANVSESRLQQIYLGRCEMLSRCSHMERKGRPWHIKYMPWYYAERAILLRKANTEKTMSSKVRRRPTLAPLCFQCFRKSMSQFWTERNCYMAAPDCSGSCVSDRRYKTLE
jgi:hypothetical protein